MKVEVYQMSSVMVNVESIGSIESMIRNADSIMRSTQSESSTGSVVNLEKNFKHCKKYDIVACSLGIGEGSEQSGTRPCVIISNNKGNKFGPTIIVAAITSSYSKGKLPTHIEIDKTCGLDRDSVILCEQVRTIDKSRIKKYLGTVPLELREKIDEALVASFEILKKGEQDAKDCAVRIECYKDMLIKMFNCHGSGCALAEIIKSYKNELNKLRKICRDNWLDSEDYYIETDDIKELIYYIRTEIVSSLKTI